MPGFLDTESKVTTNFRSANYLDTMAHLLPIMVDAVSIAKPG
jgi:hypothetical protein